MAECYGEHPDKTLKINYYAITEELFPEGPIQKLVPFLGAGVSSPRENPKSNPSAGPPGQDKIDFVCDQLGLQGLARSFMGLAVRLAYDIQSRKPGDLTPNDLLDRLAQNHFPPAATDLAEILARLSQYDAFHRARRKLEDLLSSAEKSDLPQLLRWIALLTDITSPSPPLLTASGFFEYTVSRHQLLEELQRIFLNKRWPTRTHFLVARAAHWHLHRAKASDYLVITTNYDDLMEVALDEFNVPYCVLTVDRVDRKVHARFSKRVESALEISKPEYEELQKGLRDQYPSNFHFQFNRPHPMALIYKIHGSIEDENRDSIILSDADYVEYICRDSDSNGMVPSAVGELMRGKGFLFAGYSFNDWNVRAVYQKILEKRGPNRDIHDYAILRELDVFETAFFRQKSLRLLITDLNQFNQGVRRHLRLRTRDGTRPAVTATVIPPGLGVRPPGPFS